MAQVKLPLLHKVIDVTIDSSITTREILAVICAITGYRKSSELKHNVLTKVMNVEQELRCLMQLHITKEMEEFGLKSLLEKLVDFEIVYDHRYHKKVEFTQVLTHSAIVKLASTSRRAYAQVAGILIGVDANSIFDIRPAAAGITKDFDNLATVVGTQHSKDFDDVLEQFCQSHNLVIDMSSNTDSHYEEALYQVCNSKLVVGPASFHTYAAACLDIPCIEIYSSPEELSLLSKWASLKYAAILEDEIQHVTVERLTKLWSNWEEIDKENAQDKQSIVMTADG